MFQQILKFIFIDKNLILSFSKKFFQIFLSKPNLYIESKFVNRNSLSSLKMSFSTFEIFLLLPRCKFARITESKIYFFSYIEKSKEKI